MNLKVASAVVKDHLMRQLLGVWGDPIIVAGRQGGGRETDRERT